MKFNKKAIFWDNDGILVDTEKYYFEATRRILEKTGFNLTKELYIDLILVKAKGPWHLLDPVQFPQDVITKLKKERDGLYNQFLLTGNIGINGVEEVVAQLSDSYRMAVVTSSKSGHFKTIHSRTNLLRYFEFVITAEDYSRYKPDPEPYLTALNKMNMNNKEVIVIEDSQRGLIAAKSAGLDCIIIKNELTESSDFSQADVVLNNIQELTEIL